MRFVATGWLAVVLTGCGTAPLAVPADKAGKPYALSLDVPFAELELPPDNRDGTVAPDRVPVTGPWTLLSGTDDSRTYKAALPVRPRALFFFKPPEGLQVFGPTGEAWPFGAKRPGSWKFNATSLTVVVPLDEGAPTGLTVAYPFSTQREQALNFAFSGLSDPAAFARARVEIGQGTTYSGLLLPAPAHAAFDIEVPPAGELSFRPGVVRPETADGLASDGVEFRVEVEIDGKTTVLWSESRNVDDGFSDVNVDLSAYSGKKVRLRLATSPGATARFDYALFADPVVASRKTNPQHVVLVFIDTLRRDHLGLYGYGKDTSVPLDTWAASATVFDDARTVAPWTLPSTRSLLTGRSPEMWDHAATLPSLLRPDGWATAMFGANVYLSSNFGMDGDWGEHQVTRQVNATEQVDRALAWLDAQQGRDALVLVHFMDCHIPYDEPAAYRYRYTKPGENPPGLSDDFERSAVAKLKDPPEKTRAWVTARYDQNIAFVSDEVGRLLNNLGGDDIAVVFADHGEELWDHGGFEHGHTLFDELLRVPLIVKAPGLPAGRVTEPVSLLDVTPTVLDLLGRTGQDLEGVSLVPAARGDAAAKTALASRDLAFGRPLYGTERWGVLHAGQKYTTNEGREAVYNLAEDPGEHTNLAIGKVDAETAIWRPLLGAALGRDVALGYRVFLSRASSSPKADFTAKVTVPGGVREAWVGDDPTDQSAARLTVDGEVLTITWLAGYRGIREVFFIPNNPVADTTYALGVSLLHPGLPTTEAVVDLARNAVPGETRIPLLRAKADDGRMLAISHAIAVAPRVGGKATSGSDVEMKGALESLGYVFDDSKNTKPAGD